MEGKTPAPGALKRKAGDEARESAVKLTSRIGTGILEDLKRLAKEGYEYLQVAERINSLPKNERKRALVEFVKNCMAENRIDGLDLSIILEKVRMPEKDKKEIYEKWGTHLLD